MIIHVICTYMYRFYWCDNTCNLYKSKVYVPSKIDQKDSQSVIIYCTCRAIPNGTDDNNLLQSKINIPVRYSKQGHTKYSIM